MDAFRRVLAKIAFAYAVAELGQEVAKSPVALLATEGEFARCRHFLGGRQAGAGQ